MARIRKLEKGRAAAKELTVSHRDRLVEELRADLELAAEYLNAAADDDDPRVYLSALRTVAEAQGMAKGQSGRSAPGESVSGPFCLREPSIFDAARDTEGCRAEDGRAPAVIQRPYEAPA